MAQTTTTIATLPVMNRANGPHSTPTRAVPASFDSATVLIDCTTGTPATPFTGFAHPFNSPAMSVTFGIAWSWDGGATFPQSTESAVTGQPTGIWGLARHTNAPIMTPNVGLGIPFDSTLGGSPTHYRAYMTVAGGPITFGLTVQETTG
jgi:hypothetical protein